MGRNDRSHKGKRFTRGEESSHKQSAQNYSVGYGRPPITSRFKPGVSGNIKGRPKGSKNLKTVSNPAEANTLSAADEQILGELSRRNRTKRS
jgi:hypothetical protein